MERGTCAGASCERAGEDPAIVSRVASARSGTACAPLSPVLPTHPHPSSDRVSCPGLFDICLNESRDARWPVQAVEGGGRAQQVSGIMCEPEFKSQTRNTVPKKGTIAVCLSSISPPSRRHRRWSYAWVSSPVAFKRIKKDAGKKGTPSIRVLHFDGSEIIGMFLFS